MSLKAFEKKNLFFLFIYLIFRMRVSRKVSAVRKLWKSKSLSRCSDVRSASKSEVKTPRSSSLNNNFYLIYTKILYLKVCEKLTFLYIPLPSISFSHTHTPLPVPLSPPAPLPTQFSSSLVNVKLFYFCRNNVDAKYLVNYKRVFILKKLLKKSRRQKHNQK